MKLENKTPEKTPEHVRRNLEACNLRIICILLLRSADDRCIYRIYTNDGDFLDYVGFDHLPQLVKDWLSARNSWEYVVPGCMVVSGCKVVQS